MSGAFTVWAAPGHHPAGRFRQQGLQPGRRQRFAIRRSHLPGEASGCGGVLVFLGVHFHLCHAADHRRLYPGEGGIGGRHRLG